MLLVEHLRSFPEALPITLIIPGTAMNKWVTDRGTIPLKVGTPLGQVTRGEMPLTEQLFAG